MRLIFRNNFSIFKTNKNFILEKNRGFFAFHVQKGIVSFVGCDGLIVFFFTFLYIILVHLQDPPMLQYSFLDFLIV